VQPYTARFGIKTDFLWQLDCASPTSAAVVADVLRSRLTCPAISLRVPAEFGGGKGELVLGYFDLALEARLSCCGTLVNDDGVSALPKTWRSYFANAGLNEVFGSSYP